MLWIQFTIGITNDLIDQPFDRVAKPEKPLISGLVNRQAAIIITVILIFLIFSFGMFLNYLVFIIMIFGFSLGLIYNLGIKRTIWSWIPFSIAVPTILICARLANGNGIISLHLFWAYFLGLFIGPALNMTNQMNKAEISAFSGERSLLLVLGVKKGQKLSFILFIISIFLILIFGMIFSKMKDVILLLSTLSFVFAIFFYFFVKTNQRRLLFPTGIIIVSLMGLTFLFY